jgi:hypothetical protein
MNNLYVHKTDSTDFFYIIIIDLRTEHMHVCIGGWVRCMCVSVSVGGRTTTFVDR